MKKIGVLGIIFCFLLAGFQFMNSRQTIAQSTDTGEFLTRAFIASSADVEGYSIHNWSVVSKDYKSTDELKEMGQTLSKTLAVEGAQESVKHQGDQNSYVLRGTWTNGSEVQLTLSSLKFQDQAPQTVLAVRVERKTSDLTDYSASIQRVRDTALQLGTVPQISTCISGLLADKMEDGKTNELVETIFKKAKAKEIEGVRSDLVTSVSGYSPLTKDYIVTNGNKMNLQVAVHYDEKRGQTRVLVGSPIVTIEY
ncbi:YwmB family TATA-box binding protein [Tumebacillus sp. DT12]|uniref:YwmB family TATA-box binding protein n=1 Tax=Tumebacillus lacus TaxID=2995335 RepID=A0ABT3WXY3_9BACL|nr:YwmB family TATA-box binding protein [Tumebacillus lacus]MCX7569533.1 YwmB family TATA-box binding protein [Tumebacillus lacus]